MEDSAQPQVDYNSLLLSSMDRLLAQASAESGFQDHLEEGEISDTIDINTKQYRYIGYFFASFLIAYFTLLKNIVSFSIIDN